MADKPTTSRVGRPRSRSASQTPQGKAKVGRPRSKSAEKPKVKGSGKKAAAPSKSAVRPILQLEHDVVQLKTRQFGDQLPDLSPIDLEQDNIVLNPPDQPQDLPVEEIITNSFKWNNQICPLSQKRLNTLICPLINLTNLINLINLQIRFKICQLLWCNNNN